MKAEGHIHVDNPILAQQELNQLCDSDRDLVLLSGCHKAPMRVVYEPESGILQLRCATCDVLVVSIVVAPTRG